jgi:hypothetical protein
VLIAALLALLGVNLIVIVIFAAVVIARRRWLKRQPGAFAGAIRLTVGDLDGVSRKWKRGSGRWVRDVLVWNMAPFMFRTVVIGVDGMSEQRPAAADEVKHLGDKPVVAEFVSESATFDVATSAEHPDFVVGPWSTDIAAGAVTGNVEE